MFGWFGSKAECPVDFATREWIERRWAWLTEQFGRERPRSARVILPTPEFFPDPYAAKPDDARAMFDRVCGYMGVAPETVELSWYQDRNPVYEGQWQQGTAGLYHEEAGRFRVWVEVGNIDDPLALVATMAHELGHVLLLGHGRVSQDAEDHEPLTDLLTVYLGLGLFTANAVIREQYWHAGAVSGWRMGRRGYLSMPMYGYALAKFARARSEERPPWAKHLRRDVRSAFRKACRFLAQETPVDLVSVSMTPPPLEQTSPEGDAPTPFDGVDDACLSAAALLKRYECGDRDFRALRLRGLRLCGADLRGSNLAGADLGGTDLTGAVLTEVDLRSADLQRAVLHGTTLRGSNLSEADLSGADLSGADLSGADIRGTIFTGGLLDGTILVGTARSHLTDLGDVDLSTVICDVDLSKEVLKGALFSDRAAAVYGCTQRWIGACWFAGLAALAGALVGAVVGWALGAALGVRNLVDPGGLTGAVAFGLLGVWRLARMRAPERAENRGRR